MRSFREGPCPLQRDRAVSSEGMEAEADESTAASKLGKVGLKMPEASARDRHTVPEHSRPGQQY